MKKNTFVEGTIIASSAIILIKILGAIYVVPLYAIVGEKGGSLYSYAYNIYSLFLDISTAGLPIAMSKIISEYNTLQLYEAKERSYKIGRNIILMFSLISFFALFVFSKEFAYIFIGNMTGGNTIEDISLVIKSISFSLLIIPFLSIARGYLQGHKFIAPSSFSQMLEQIIRIAIVLMGAYITINVLNKGISIGVAIALQGAFFGGIVAYQYLHLKIKKNKEYFNLDKITTPDNISNKQITKKIITYAIPFIITSIAIDVYSITDQALVIKGLSSLHFSSLESETIASIISTWGSKICMIINAVAMGLSVSLIPHMVSSYVKKDLQEVNNRFNQAIGVILVTTIPITVGMSILANPIYYLFYGSSTYGGIILRILSFVALFASVNIVICTSLQGLNKFKAVYICTIAGFLTNALCDLPFIYLCDKIGIYPFYGACFSSMFGYTISYVIALNILKKEEKMHFKDILLILKDIIIPLIAMIIPILILNHFINLNGSSKIIIVLVLFMYALIGSVIYAVLTYKNGVLEKVFGKEYIAKIIKKINIFKKFKGIKNT